MFILMCFGKKTLTLRFLWEKHASVEGFGEKGSWCKVLEGKKDTWNIFSQTN